jgi:hypothetical protein
LGQGTQHPITEKIEEEEEKKWSMNTFRH